MANMNEKVTKKDNFAALRTIVENLGDSQYDGLLEFIDKEMAAIDNRAAKAKERAAAKREASDELRDRIYSLLTTDFKSGDAIVVELDDENVTKNKVISRLSALIKSGKVVKEKQKNGKTSVMMYKLAEESDITDDDEIEE